MNRGDFEKEILQMMGLLVQSTGAISADTDIGLRRYVQSKLDEVVADLTGEAKWKFRRQTFGAYVPAPKTTCTLSWTQFAKTATVAGAVPDVTWYGAHIVIDGNGFPLTIASYSGQTLTLVEPVMKADGAAVTVSIYHDAFLVPTDCAIIRKNTMALAGYQTLVWLDRPDFDHQQGYAALNDYGLPAEASSKSSINLPDVSQPLYFYSSRSVMVSGIMRNVMALYPYPDQAYAMTWEGWRKPTAVVADGAGTNDADYPDFPEHFHRSLLLPSLKLAMGDYPGFELSGTEKQVCAGQKADALRRFYSEQRDDENENQPFRPAAVMIG